jgi:hypothetical protein
VKPHDTDIDPNFDKELQKMWQESTYSQPGDPSEVARRIADRVLQFDRNIFWRNLREYAAGWVMMIVFAYGAVFNHGRVVSLIGLVAMSFVVACLWWQHRDLRPLDPSADARGYQAALLARFDRQIRLLRTARYWYFLPMYIWVLAATTVLALHRPPHLSPLAHAVGLAIGLGVVTATFAWLSRLNQRAAEGRLTEAKRQAEALLVEHREGE